MNEVDGQASKLRRRVITADDFGTLTELLVRGFPERPAHYWRTAFDRLAAHAPRPDPQNYGYLLEAAGVPVAVLLLIPMAVDPSNGETFRYNLSSWYADPAFRGYASTLIASALQNKQVTYLNISPAAHTLPLIQAQGFICYASGQLFAVPILSPPRRGFRVRGLMQTDETLPERDLLLAHAACGCLSLICDTPKGPLPFVLSPRKIGRRVIPAMQVVYCRDVGDVVACAGALGRFLLLRGIACLIVDANGPIPGLVGIYYEGKAPKYFRGPHAPRLGDLAYSELALFGA